MARRVLSRIGFTNKTRQCNMLRKTIAEAVIFMARRSDQTAHGRRAPTPSPGALESCQDETASLLSKIAAPDESDETFAVDRLQPVV